MHDKICLSIFIFVIASLLFVSGYFTGDRHRSVKDGLVHDQLRTELAAERARNTELERLRVEDGIELNKLRTELSIIGEQLQLSWGAIESLASIQWNDTNSIREVRKIIDELRTKIKECQESPFYLNNPNLS